MTNYVLKSNNQGCNVRHIYKKGHQRVLMVATIVGQRMQRQPKECQGRQGCLRTPNSQSYERERERERERALNNLIHEGKSLMTTLLQY